jgi:uncharacterized protein (TIGR03000 family)
MRSNRFFGFAVGVLATLGLMLLPEASHAQRGGGSTAQDETVHVEVRLPDANARLWFEGSKTQQTGTLREFQSPDLKPGQEYVYHIRAQWMENGRTREQTRTLTVRPGEWWTVDFISPAQLGNTRTAASGRPAGSTVNTSFYYSPVAGQPPYYYGLLGSYSPGTGLMDTRSVGASITPPNGGGVAISPAAPGE